MTVFKKIIASISAALVSLSVTIPVFASAFHDYDVNGDGRVTMSDYTVLTMLLDGYKPLSYDKYDVTNNGVVSYADAATIFDYYRYGSSASSASVANFNALTPPTADIASVYNSVTYLKRNCSTGAITEYTLNTNGDEAASTASAESSTPMELDPNETAVVKLTAPDGDLIGTGTIIDDHIIATAAHCVYDKVQSEFLDINVRIVGTGYTEIASYTPSYIHIPKLFITSHSNKDDYALIYVDEDLSSYGKFEIGLALDSFVTDTTGKYSVKVSGFPANMSSQYDPDKTLDEQYISQICRYVSEGNIYGTNNILNGSANTNIMCHYAITYNGDSGGPVYVDETYEINGVNYSCKTMVGIHLNGYSKNDWVTDKYAVARRITADQLRFYRANTNLN